MNMIVVCRAARVAGLASLVAHHVTPGSEVAPRIVLAHPGAGMSVPRSSATVMFRYAAGEASDPIDLRTFTVFVDDVDRTSHFRVTADAAWGTIVDAGGNGLKAHGVRARICSIRGLCAEVSANVIVVGESAPQGTKPRPTRRERFIDLFLEAARRLLRP
ncbi:MAG TPA: hypothetical protein VFB46_11505 [Gemmatimonadaceae bacterium]|nr:hypothetical protein [Gemmatimonadaceae bacterium]